MIVVAAIHGILTGQTRASWPDEFDAWMTRRDPRVHVLKKEYAAGPFPRLNWLKNRRLSKGLAEELQLFEETPREQRERREQTRIWFVAHSNGAVIALMTARRLIERGVKVSGVILTGAAVESDVERNGVRAWVDAGTLGRAVAFSSHDDGVVKTDGILAWLKWPYGNLGRVGWQRERQPYRTRSVYTLWFAGGHCVYFRPDRVHETFELFYQQIIE